MSLLLYANSTSKCRTIDVCDIFGDSSGVALYQLDGNANDTGGNYHGTETAITYGGGAYERGAIIASGKIDTGTKTLMPSTSNYSVSCWVKRTDGIRNVLASRMQTTTPYGDNIEWSSNNTIEVTFATSSSTQNVAATAAITKTAGTWCHVVWAVNRTSNINSIYVDGVLQSTGAITVPSSGYDNNLNVLIGAYHNTNYSGTYDQVRIFNRAITATEVATLYAECAPTSTVSVDSNVLNQAVAHYKLDGNALDTTGNYNGTETAMTYADGRFGQAGVFNGSTSKITSSAQVIPNGAMSVSLWWKNTGSVSYLAGNGVATADKGIAIYHVANGVAGFSIYKGVTAAALTLSTTNTFAGNTWHHMVITWDGTANANGAKVYVNGVFQVQGTSDTSSATIGAYSSFGIGGLNGGVYTTGSIDQIRFYNKALTATDVTALYNEALPTSTVDTVQPLGDTSVKAFYKFNGDATDATGTYNGTATNVTYSAGKFGNAAVFNGTTAKHDVPNGAFDYQVFSFSCWVYTGDTSANARVIASTRNTSATKGWWFGFQAGALKFYHTDAATFVLTYTTSETNVWRYYTVTRDSAGKMNLYRDGTVVSTGTSATAFTFAANSNSIGYNRDLNNNYYLGSIDQFRFFNKALTYQEVQAIYSESSYAKTTLPTVELDPFLDNSCKALYKFDNTVLDAYGQYDGTATNVTYGTGKFGQCAVFNGTSSKVDFTAISTAKALSFWTNKAITNGTYKSFISNVPSTARICTGETAGAISGETLTFQGSSGIAYIQTVFNDTTWKHIVVQYIADNNIHIYINGIRQTVLYYNTATNILPSFSTIGNDNGTAWLDASLDQVRFFNKALTPLEVASLYNETTPLEEPMYKLVDPFKDGSGKALYRLDGNALDESGNANVTNMSVNTYAAGKFGRALLGWGYTTNLTYDKSPSGIFTHSCWIYRPTVYTGTNPSLFFRLGDGDPTSFFLNQSENNIGWQAVGSVGPNAVAHSGWTHVVLVKNGTTCTTYIDGVSLGTWTSSRTLTANDLFMGGTTAGLYHAGNEVPNSLLEQVRIFNRALTAGEVSKLYTGENNVL